MKGYFVKFVETLLRPPLNKELFPVHRPSGLKRADWNYLLKYFTNNFFFTPPPPPPLYILVYKKKMGGK